jgi:hypothetical protein
MIAMETGNFLVTRCPRAADPFFRACTIPLTTIALSNNFTIFHWVGTPHAKHPMRLGSGSNILPMKKMTLSLGQPHC